MKTCPKCTRSKPENEFSKDRTRTDGLARMCQQCFRAYQNSRYDSNRQQKVTRARNQRRDIARTLVMGYLQQHGCVDCPETDPVVLEFDHLRDKEKSISRMMQQGSNVQDVIAEMEKCEVVCANCHRRRTYQRANSYRNAYSKLV